jgi:hypothetical protein
MRKIMCVVLAAAAAMPFASFAQSTAGHVSRTQVCAELAQLEAVGYRPSTHDADYPQALQSAEAKVAALDAYGGAQPNTQTSGDAAHRADRAQ